MEKHKESQNRPNKHGNIAFQPSGIERRLPFGKANKAGSLSLNEFQINKNIY